MVPQVVRIPEVLDWSWSSITLFVSVARSLLFYDARPPASRMACVWMSVVSAAWVVRDADCRRCSVCATSVRTRARMPDWSALQIRKQDVSVAKLRGVAYSAQPSFHTV